MEKTEIFFYKPDDFKTPLIVAGGVLLFENRFLLLKRHPEKIYGEFWNLPAGKVENAEDPQLGAQREIFEETGILIPLKELNPLKTFFIKRGTLNIQFHVYKKIFFKKPDLFLKLDENIDAKWTTQEESSEMNLLGGGHEIIKYCLH